MAIESNPFDTDEINAAIAECYADNYRNGFVPPHYPVPALRDEVEIQYDRVILWRKSTPMWDMKYLAIGW